jgi:hypothetical protein
MDIGADSYKSVESILKNGLDKMPLAQKLNNNLIPLDHENVRGRDYFK